MKWTDMTTYYFLYARILELVYRQSLPCNLMKDDSCKRSNPGAAEEPEDEL